MRPNEKLCTQTPFFNDLLDDRAISTQTGNLAMGGFPQDWMNRFFAGDIDDIRIYDRALMESEIDSLCHEGGWYPPVEGLVAYYPFNGNANDESGHDRNGEVTGAILAPDRFGVGNASYKFDGMDDYIVAAGQPLINNDFSYSAWIKVDGDNYRQYIQSFGVMGPEPNHLWNFAYANQGGAFDLWDATNGAFHIGYAQPDTTLPWTHVVIVYESGTQYVYVNDSLLGTRTVSMPIADAGGRTLLLGILRTDILGDQRFNGQIDDVRLYDRALSQTEVDSLYHLGGWPPLPPQADPIAYYPFNGNAYDSSGSGNHGTIVGTVLDTLDRFGQQSALFFDGITGYVVVSNSNHPLGNVDITYSCWVKSLNDPQDRWRPIIDCGEVSAPRGRSALEAEAPQNYRVAYTINVDYTGFAYYLVHNEWTQLVLTKSGNDVSLFANGAFVGSNVMVGQNVRTSEMRFGGPGVNFEEYFHGSIDDIRIYNRALSEAEIDSLYHLGGWPLPPPTTSQVNLLAFDGCGDSLQLYFGLASSASDCIDSTYGERDLPPIPPSGAFDVRFKLPCDSASLRDFRSDLLTEAKWKLQLQACSLPITLKWDTLNMPAGHMRMRDPFDGVLIDMDMKAETELVINNPGISELWIYLYQDECLPVTASERWNMVSLPLEPARQYLEVFPSANTPPYKYEGGAGYVESDTVRPGIGYWLKFVDAVSENVCGAPTFIKDIPVSVGWNMIGAYEDVIDVASVRSTPPGILGSPFYVYGGTYQIATVLEPGKAYWVRANTAGTIHLGPTWMIAGPAWKNYEKIKAHSPNR